MSVTNTSHRDEPLRDAAAESPDAAREIEVVVALLRALPDPEPESDLTARVMRRVVEIETRPRVLRPIFGRSPGNRVAAALAAGIACAAVGIGLQAPRTPSTIRSFDVASTPPATPRSIRPPGVSPGVAQGSRLAMASAYADPSAAAWFSGATGNSRMAAFPVVAAPAPDLLDNRLDAQLNALQLDPQAFFRRLERMQERDRFVQRLAERAARRGDAAQVALNVRAVPHPLAPPTVDRFLRASLVRQASGR